MGRMFELTVSSAEACFARVLFRHAHAGLAAGACERVRMRDANLKPIFHGWSLGKRPSHSFLNPQSVLDGSQQQQQQQQSQFTHLFAQQPTLRRSNGQNQTSNTTTQPKHHRISGFQAILAPQAQNPGRHCPHKSRLTIHTWFGKPGVGLKQLSPTPLNERQSILAVCVYILLIVARLTIFHRNIMGSCSSKSSPSRHSNQRDQSTKRESNSPHHPTERRDMAALEEC